MTSRVAIALVLLTSTLASDDINDILNILVDLRDFEQYYDSKFEPTAVNSMYPILRNLFDLDDVVSSTETSKDINIDKLLEDGKYMHQPPKPYEETSKQIENEIPYNVLNRNLQKYKLYAEEDEPLPRGKTDEEIKYDFKTYEDINKNQSNNNSYEVHENVFDTIDKRTPPSAVVGYTRPVQLNTVKPSIMNITTIDSDDNNTISYDTGNKTKQDNINILHINEESDDDTKFNNDTDNSVIKEILNLIKSYFVGLQKGFTTKVHDFFSKNVTGSRRYHVRHLMGDKNKQNYSDVDKTDYYVRHRHISLT